METKCCSTCKIDLPATSEYFASRTDRKASELQGNCRSCQKQYRKEHYQKNREKYIDKAKLIKKKDKVFLRDFKQTLSCSKCGESRYWTLDFHHVDPTKKDGIVSMLIGTGQRKKALAEIEKCIVLCANCHRDVHYQMKLADNA